MEKLNIQEILTIIIKNKKPILIFTCIAAITSALASYFITPKYKSIAVVFPVNLSPSSEESNTEQLLQYFTSENVKNAVAKKNNLFSHYKIKPQQKEAKSLFDFYYQENISISPTIYESIEISVKDESPEKAQQIAQSLIDETNVFISNLKKERLREYIKNSSSAITRELATVDSVVKTLNQYREKYGVIDFEAQSRYLSKKTIAGQKLSDTEQLLFEGIKTGKMETEKLGSFLNGKMSTLNYFESENDKYLLDYLGVIQYTNVVSNPTLPDKKCYPVRWAIVTFSTLAAFAFASLYFIFFAKAANVKSSEQ